MNRLHQFSDQFGWDERDNPVFRYESSRVQSSAIVRLSSLFLFVMFGLLVTVFTMAVVLWALSTGLSLSRFGLFNNLANSIMQGLAILTFILVLLQIVLGAGTNMILLSQTAPLISGEIELQSWSLLRTTMLPLRSIIRGKLLATMHHMRMPLLGLLILRGIIAGNIALIIVWTYWRDAIYYESPLTISGLLRSDPVVLALFVIVVGFITFLTQPLLQFYVNGTLGLFASTLGRSRAQALVVALGIRLALWITVILANVALYVSVQSAYNELRFSGPGWSSFFEAVLTLLIVLGFILINYLFQIGLAFIMLGAVQLRARSLGV
ncbi:MAG: hypothetical protein GYB68_03405 [Chloroflexi bacterium]|nr:hypothetical protein [Chloroflexota bacterium]